MNLYMKSDMQFTDYQWKAYPINDPRINGKLDSTRFNRYEGFEVLYLINSLAELWGFKSRVSCLRIEKMIREKLPSTIITQDDLKEWIRQNRKS